MFELAWSHYSGFAVLKGHKYIISTTSQNRILDLDGTELQAILQYLHLLKYPAKIFADQTAPFSDSNILTVGHTASSAVLSSCIGKTGMIWAKQRSLNHQVVTDVIANCSLLITEVHRFAFCGKLDGHANL